VLNNLPQLSLLDLRDNRIEQLPDEIGLLQALERLDLTNNTLSRYIFKVLWLIIFGNGSVQMVSWVLHNDFIS
jgi:hypothetical protein